MKLISMTKSNKILVISTFSLIGSIIFTFIAFPGIINFVVRDQTALKRRNLMRKFYLKLPLTLKFSVYFFNISNPDEVQRGGKPVLTEVGPYIYDAYKEKIDVTENEGEDTLSYTPYETYFFNPQLSAPLSDTDLITVLNPIAVGVVYIVARDMPPLLPIAARALKYIINDPQTIYLTTSVRQFLFGGLVMNCTNPDFSVKAVCAQIRSLLVGLNEEKKDILKFSMLGPRNGTLPVRVKVHRGIKKSYELGSVAEINNEKESQVWASRKCNRFSGTDTWIFPPFVDKEKGIKAYSLDLCKNLVLYCVEELALHGVDVQKYYGDIGDQSRPEEKCYCRTPKTCLPKGVLDLQKCMGVPIFATLPHFLFVDNKLAGKVEGLQPVTDEHIIRILMQPLLAVPLEAQKRMQFNMFLKPQSKVQFMKSVPELLHPIFWVEEAVFLEGTLLKLIKSVFVLLKVFSIVNYVLIGASAAGIVVGGVVYMKNRTSAAVTPLLHSLPDADTSSREVILKSAEKSPSSADEVNIEKITTPAKSATMNKY